MTEFSFFALLTIHRAGMHNSFTFLAALFFSGSTP
jgi:hypothetical protein